MKFEIHNTSDMSEYEVSAIVNWQVWECLKGKKCTICNQLFTIKDKNAICSGRDKDGNLTAAHIHCWNKNN